MSLFKLQSAQQFSWPTQKWIFFLLPLDILDNVRKSGKNRMMDNSATFQFPHNAHYKGI